MDLLDRTPPVADHRIHYGPAEFQFGDLWLPKLDGVGRGALPVVVFLHGGWWKSEYGLGYGGHLAAALRGDGLAVWSIEYRRVGSTGGGWPTTFEDVGAGFDFLERLGGQYGLDLTRVVVAGHSAGGHLAFWLAGRQHVPQGSGLVGPEPRVKMRAVVALAGAVGLRLTIDLAGRFRFAHDRDEVYRLMGGTPEQVPERYRAGDPGDLLPLNVGQILIQGTDDDQIPQLLPSRWAQLAGRQGDRVQVRMIPGASHFDVVDPLSGAWMVVRETIRTAALG